MENKVDKTKWIGYIMAGIGFTLIIIGALNYVLHWQLGSPPAVFGIIFTAVGMAKVRRSR